MVIQFFYAELTKTAVLRIHVLPRNCLALDAEFRLTITRHTKHEKPTTYSKGYLLDGFDFIQVAFRVDVGVAWWEALANHDSRQECNVMSE